MVKDEDAFDKFVEKLQQEIIDEETKAYNKHVVDLFHNPKNWGIPSNFTVSHSLKGSCNDTMEFFLTIKDGIIESANFYTDGCGATVATGSQTTLLIEGKPIEFAENLKPEDLDRELHGLPDDHKHCLVLTVDTLKGAIEKYKNNKV